MSLFGMTSYSAGILVWKNLRWGVCAWAGGVLRILGAAEECGPAGGRRLQQAELSSAAACDISMPSWQCFAFPAAHGWRARRWIIKLWTSKQSWGAGALKSRRSQGQFPVGCFAWDAASCGAHPSPSWHQQQPQQVWHKSFIRLQPQSNSLRAFPKLIWWFTLQCHLLPLSKFFGFCFSNDSKMKFAFITSLLNSYS